MSHIDYRDDIRLKVSGLSEASGNGRLDSGIGTPHRVMTHRVLLLTTVAMVAFAGNAILGRMALRDTGIDAVTFTMVRLAAGAVALLPCVGLRGRRTVVGGDWTSAAVLFGYALAISFAYAAITLAPGALLFFGVVQAMMIVAGLRDGEVLNLRQAGGVLLAIGGLVGLLLPGLAAPPVAGAAVTIASAVAWGIYSLRGRRVSDPRSATAGNFLRATALVLPVSALALPWANYDPAGIALAVASGSVTSGLGYLVWYVALRGLPATHAGIAQLSVPILAAAGAMALLDEPISMRFVLASVATLGGIALVILGQSRERKPARG